MVGVGNWYFSSTSDSRGDLSLYRGFYWAFRYNLGSLALGSFIIAILAVISTCLGMMDSQFKKAVESSNACLVCFRKCFKCCLDACNLSIGYINTNAYVQLALTGEDFCTSAWTAFVLGLKNAATFLIVSGVSVLVCLSGVFLIALMNTAVGGALVKILHPEMEEPFGPMMVIFGMSLAMGAVFMKIFGDTSLTILQCLYIDVDICKQN